MCGIFGIWNRDRRPVDVGVLVAGTSSLRHRGPDDEGYLLVDTSSGRAVLAAGEETSPRLALPHIGSFAGQQFDLAFGFRRLAIVDVSDAGHQPMSDESRSHWIVFNGEIYNYVELRQELTAKGYRFRSDTDTEVLLAAYEEWGAACLSRLNGMWAFALWDAGRGELFVSRDRFGIKPLYYSDDGQTFAFASEAKALVISGVVAFEPSPVTLGAFIALGRSPSATTGATFFRRVSALLPAHSLRVTRSGAAMERHWRLPDLEGERPGDGVDEYRELFRDAVRLHLRSDVAVGTCLSGGLDSSSIVAVVSDLMQNEHGVAHEQLGERQRTFSAVYDSAGVWNERSHIDVVLRDIPAVGSFTIPRAESLWRDLPRLAWHQDEPFPTASIFAQWCVMRLARENGVTVLLDGQGADEVFGGYHGSYGVHVADVARSDGLGAAWREWRSIRSVAGMSARIFARGVARQLSPKALQFVALPFYIRQVRSSALAPAVRQQVLEELRSSRHVQYYPAAKTMDDLVRGWVSNTLPDLLRFEDRNSMAFSVEGRVPFLDYRLVEFVFRHARRTRIRDGWTKWLQRRAVEGLLPPEIVWRRDKVGFATPEVEWLRGSPDALRQWSDRAAAYGQWLDAREVRAEIERLIAAGGSSSRVWRLVSTVAWLEAFGNADRR